MLPYLEEQPLYDSIDFNKSWDDPAHAEAREVEIEVLECPSAHYEEQHRTSYLGIFGPESFFTGATPMLFSDVTDGLAKTIAITEVGKVHSIHWMDPQDMAADEFDADEFDDLDLQSLSRHPGVFQVMFLDAHAKAISVDIDREVLRAMLTVAGGEDPEAQGL